MVIILGSSHIPMIPLLQGGGVLVSLRYSVKAVCRIRCLPAPQLARTWWVPRSILAEDVCVALKTAPVIIRLIVQVLEAHLPQTLKPKP